MAEKRKRNRSINSEFDLLLSFNKVNTKSVKKDIDKNNSVDDNHLLNLENENTTENILSEHKTNICSTSDLITTSDEDVFSSDSEAKCNLKVSLRDAQAEWVVQNHITNDSAKKLLQILRRYHPDLPLDVRTIKKNESDNRLQSKISNLGTGKHFKL